jgi:hypothetical protein
MNNVLQSLRSLFSLFPGGINKSDIFQDGQNKMRFLERMSETFVEDNCTVYA